MRNNSIGDAATLNKTRGKQAVIGFKRNLDKNSNIIFYMACLATVMPRYLNQHRRSPLPLEVFPFSGIYRHESDTGKQLAQLIS